MKRKPDAYVDDYNQLVRDDEPWMISNAHPICFCKPELLDWVEEVRAYIQNNVDDGCHGVELDLLDELNSILPEVKSNE